MSICFFQLLLRIKLLKEILVKYFLLIEVNSCSPNMDAAMRRKILEERKFGIEVK